MELKYALLSDSSGIPIASFDLANGDVITDEVLFSGFISAIQAFMQEFENLENPSKHGLISAGNMQILFNRGKQTIGVLVGYDIDMTAINQLEFLVNNFEESIGYDFGYWSLNDLLDPFIETYWRNLLSTFRDQVFHDYYIPFLNIEDKDSYNERIQDEKVDIFLSFVDGKKSLREISWFSGIDWNSLTLMLSDMINFGSIYLEVSQSSEQTLYLTHEGLNVLLGKSDPPVTIIDIWDEVGVTLLNEITPLRPMGEILHRMRNIVELYGEEIIFGVLKELLHEFLVKPYPSIFNISSFLQNYYLTFYSHTSNLSESYGDQLLEGIADSEKLKVLYPSFENNDMRSPEKMYELIKDISFDELKEFLSRYLKPINNVYNTIKEGHGLEFTKELQIGILHKLRANHADLIDKFNLEELLKFY